MLSASRMVATEWRTAARRTLARIVSSLTPLSRKTFSCEVTQVPQLLRSVAVSTHAPPQIVVAVPVHAHFPLAHVAPVAHLFPQAPHDVTSLERSAQKVPQLT